MSSDNPDLWRGRQWRFVYGPEDLDIGGPRCRHAQRHPRMRHLPLPKAGLAVLVLDKDGVEHHRATARSRTNRQAIINLEVQV